MASTYNPYSDIEKVYNAKVGWNNATTDEERKRQNEIANAARKNLEAYGYGDVANQISSSGADATTARKIMEQYAPKTTTATVETNNLKSKEINRENAGLFDKYNQSYEDLTKTNPFETDVAKSILGKYSLAGLQARDNATASGGASNGGNIDSYSAANALRQQASLVGQGQSKVLEAHQQKIDNVRGLLSDMGVNIDRVFNQDETAKNNDVARKSEIANVTGYVPNEWIIKNDDVYSTYLNEDGTFKQEMNNVDIQALINSAKASGDTDTAKKLAVVRARKILNNYGEFGKYANEGDISYMTPQETEARRQFDKQDALARETLNAETSIGNAEINAKKEIEAGKNATDLAVASLKAKEPTLTLTQAENAIKRGEVSQAIIDAYNYYHGTSYTPTNPPKIKSDDKKTTPSLLDDKTGDSEMTDSQVQAWANELNREISEKYGSKFTAVVPTSNGNYKRGDADADYIILKVFGSDSLTQEQKEYLLYDKFGITENEVNAALNDKHYR